MRVRARLPKDISGQSVTEMALILPILLVLVFGVFELGRIVFVFSALNNASREAARFGAASGSEQGSTVARYLDCAAIRARARETAFLAGLTDGDIQIAYDTPASGTMAVYAHCGDVDLDVSDIHQGDRIVVTITRSVAPIVPIPGLPTFSPTFVTARSILKNITIGPVECSDGLDNDGDSLTDYPDDPGCTGPDDTTEALCYGLSVVSNPAEGGILGIVPGANCANRYIEETYVTLSASAGERYAFDSWSGDTSGTATSTQVFMDTDKDIVANFRLLEADLAVVKTGTPGPAVGSDKLLTYALQVTNGGPDPARDVVVTDTLPANVTYVGLVSNGWTCEDAAAPIIVCELSDLAVGTPATFQIEVMTPVANGGPISIDNVASVTGFEFDPVTSNNVYTYTSTVEPRAELSIEKEGPSGTIWADTQFDYTIRVTNDGPSDATDVVVTDNLPDSLAFVPASDPASDDCTYSASTDIVTCEIPFVAANDTATVSITVRAPDNGTTVNNSAGVTSNETEDDISDNTSNTVSDDVESHADLEIVKSAPASVSRDVAFNYAIVVNNLGPSDATGVTVVDELPPGVNYISQSGDDCSEIDPGIVICAIGDLDAGDDATVTIQVEATEDTEGDVPPLVNRASVSSDIDDLVTGNNSDTAETEVTVDVDLTITKSATDNSVHDGDSFSYVIAVGNGGPSTAKSVILSDTLPGGVDFDGIEDAGGWSCDTSSLPTITCEPLDGFLYAGDSTTIIINVTANGVGSPDNTASLDSAETDPVTGSTEVTVAASSDLSLNITAPSSSPPDTPFDLTISVVNHGPSDASQVQVTLDLDPDVSLVSASGSGWSCDTPGVCTAYAIAANDNATITVSVTAAGTSSVTNGATVTSASSDDNSDNNSDSEPTTIQ